MSEYYRTYAGIHLSGPSAHKTSVVIMTGGLGVGNLKITHLFDKVGANGKLFSDERILDILKATLPDKVFIDCPISEPPCVACQQPSCPGVDACIDLGVAYMQSIVAKEPKARKRKKPINPQSQRVWDIQKWSQNLNTHYEPSYSANMAPLVTRAKTLQRRIKHWNPALVLQETSVTETLSIILSSLGQPSSLVFDHKSNVNGKETRKAIINVLINAKLLREDGYEDLIASPEAFQGMVTALVACFHAYNATTEPKNDFEKQQGWVYLPETNILENK